MPILLILLLTGATARVDWPEPPFGIGPAGSFTATLIVTLLPVLATLLLARWAANTVRAKPFRRSEVASIYVRLRRRLGFIHMFALVVAIGGLGWGWTVWNTVTVETEHGPRLAPFAEILVPAPYLLAVALSWLAHYGAEREFHRVLTGEGEFWSRAGHFGSSARPFALLVLMPVGLFVCQQTFGRLAPETAAHWATQIAAVLIVPVLFVLLPLAVKPVLGLTPLPHGPARERLEGMARRLGFRYRDLLLWPTRGGMANALVVGIVPWARYVIVTDRLLEALEPDELDAVFGHEVGHVRHGHIPYYLLFIALSAAVMSVAAAVIVQEAAEIGWIEPTTWDDWLTLPPLVVMGCYVFLVFGFLSRKCERQADVYGAKAAAPGKFAVSAAGVNAMVNALRRVADLNGLDADDERPMRSRLRSMLRAWQHGPIPDRVRFLRRLLDDPELEPRFQRRVFALRCGLLLALAAVFVLLGFWVGWAELARMV
jgi:STE24 endopeptidase